MTENNRDKFIQLVERYGQLLKFYNVEELCADKFAQITEFFPDVGADRHSIAMFYRFFIQYLLPQEIEKVLYLDSDIIVNLDVIEFWQIELGDKPFGAVPEFYQISDKDVSIESRKKSITICREGVVNPEDYFNSGVMLMNLKALREEEETILAGMKFISENPQFTFLDQDILNYCFSTSYLKLPVRFNRFVLYARLEDDLIVQKNIYHFAASRMCFTMDMNDPYNRMFMDYFIKTPWINADTKVALSGGIPSQKNYPISVIIPLYNMEEYIKDCLDSLLIQTFRDFEVIVVDDCSTDGSVKIVEEYAPKFNGRLKIEKTEKNSGTGGHVSRNIGLMLARGDYVYFIDADDMILGNALETMYKAAIFYNADVVYTSSYYSLKTLNDIFLIKDGVSKKDSKVKTEFIIDDQNKNLSRLFIEGSREIITDSWTKLGGPGNDLAVWTKLISRDLLLKNKIFFANIVTSGDVIFTINLYCHARRFLRISTPLYLHRSDNTNSITRMTRQPQEKLNFWFSCLVDLTKALHELKSKNEILAENPIYYLEVLRIHFIRFLRLTEDARKEFDSREIYKILYNEFVNSSDNSSTLLLPFLTSFIDAETRTNEYYSKIIDKFNRYFTARVDIKFMSTEGDFQIVSVSDNKAVVRKPPFLQKDGIGYQIQSYASSMEIIVKATADGPLRLNLKGLDVRDSKNKRVPYWIDYTNLTVNGRKIFEKLTPTWHDRPYRYMFDVKAGDEITIQTEWLPHQGDAPAATPKKVEPIAKKFLPYLTCRVDVQLERQGEGDFQILSVSDDKANVRKADWLPENEIGYFIQSYKGKMEVVAKATADGRIVLKLKGMYIRNPEDKSKRVPYWIDYTNLTVNGEKIFEKLTPTWHDRPYRYMFDVKAGDEIKIQTEWIPHRSDI